MLSTCFLTGLVNTLFSTDGGQRKRKDDGELEVTPAKRKPVGNEDDSVLGEVDEETTNALQNLQLANDTLEVQQNTVPITTSGLVPTTEHPLKDTKALDLMSEQTSNNAYQPTGRVNCICSHNYCLTSL